MEKGDEDTEVRTRGAIVSCAKPRDHGVRAVADVDSEIDVVDLVRLDPMAVAGTLVSMLAHTAGGFGSLALAQLLLAAVPVAAVAGPAAAHDDRLRPGGDQLAQVGGHAEAVEADLEQVALPAGVLAVALSTLALPLFLRAAPEGIPRLGLVGLDLTTVAAAFGLVILTALLHFSGGITNPLALFYLFHAFIAALLRIPHEIRYADGFVFRPLWLPAPLGLAAGLLAARGVPLGERIGTLKFMAALRKRRWRLHPDTTVKDLLDANGQRGQLRRYLWEPLCVSALNTPLELASANVFLAALRDTLGADAQAADLLLPRVDLSRLFPEPAAHYVRARGGTVLLRHAVEQVTVRHAGFDIQASGSQRAFTHVISALPPYRVIPVVAKLQTRQLLHKSDAGAVHVGLTSERAVRAAFRELTALGAAHGVADCEEGVVIQPMVAGGVLPR